MTTGAAAGPGAGTANGGVERIVLRPTGRFLLVQRVNHVVPAVTLLLAAAEGLSGGHHKSLWLTALEVAVGAGLLLVLARDLRRGARAGHSRVSLFDVVAAGAVTLEGVHRYNPDKGFQPAWFYFLIAVATLVLGLQHHRIAALARAEIGRDGFLLRWRPFRPLRVAWRDVAAITHRGSELAVTTAGGHRIAANLRGCANHEVVFAAIERGLAAYRDTAAALATSGTPVPEAPPATAAADRADAPPSR
jgi:hypothetical protein